MFQKNKFNAFISVMNDVVLVKVNGKKNCFMSGKRGFCIAFFLPALAFFPFGNVLLLSEVVNYFF